MILPSNFAIIFIITCVVPPSSSSVILTVFSPCNYISEEHSNDRLLDRFMHTNF